MWRWVIVFALPLRIAGIGNRYKPITREPVYGAEG